MIRYPPFRPPISQRALHTQGRSRVPSPGTATEATGPVALGEGTTPWEKTMGHWSHGGALVPEGGQETLGLRADGWVPAELWTAHRTGRTSTQIGFPGELLSWIRS